MSQTRLLQVLAVLPREQVEEVLDFAEFLAYRQPGSDRPTAAGTDDAVRCVDQTAGNLKVERAEFEAVLAEPGPDEV